MHRRDFLAASAGLLVAGSRGRAAERGKRIAFLGTDPGFWELSWQLNYVHDRSGPAVTALYLGAYFTAAIGWALLLAARSVWVRWSATALTCVGLCVQAVGDGVDFEKGDFGGQGKRVHDRQYSQHSR